MKRIESWSAPSVSQLAGESLPVRLYDTAHAEVREVAPDAQGRVRLYVCGITPYDATHLGHAATYLAFDTLVRALMQAGHEVDYAQNVTDVDDPLLERAAKLGVQWETLAEEQTDLFRSDMAALRVIPPSSYVRVADVVDEVAQAVSRLLTAGFAYRVATGDAAGDDVYFDVIAAQNAGHYSLGEISHFSPEQLADAFVEFGGDPQRPGKRSAFDPLLWRAERPGEPAWDTPVGRGRPGWHIECSVIATGALGEQITIQGGGRDLCFPHHEMSAAHASALTNKPFASGYAHCGLIAYQGAKMSKSLGNLVLVSRLTALGHDPAAIRLTVLTHHYRSDWEWTDAQLSENEARLARWRAAASRAQGAGKTLAERIRAAITDDLDTPTAIAVVDEWAEQEIPDASVISVVDALLGIDLTDRIAG